jgi:two-component system, NtrC family, sensor kinase
MNPVPPFLAAFFLIPFAQKFLQTSTLLPIWHNRLRVGRIIAFVLTAMELFVSGDYIAPPVFFCILILVAIPAVLLYKQLPNARLFLWMVLPFALVFLVDNLMEFWTPKLYKANEDSLDGLKACALIASFVLAIIANKQQKNFDKKLKEQQRLLEIEEANNRLLEAKKLDLETQVAARTAELVAQKEELQQALEHLKATQVQLIQSEKLASLGELTAGIAHEIQNPLNFVNNFSELSVELAKELKEERLKAKEERDEELENELVDDLIQNQEKINLHGKRAASIVSGMLQHSRASTGTKELTDINKLADEYLRLSYHGLRAKEKSGSATRFQSDYELISDPKLPQINIVSQDVGRVLLNLINNAFYAVSKRNAISNLPNAPEYKPKVKISTKQIDNQIQITIQDNGIGMSKEVQSKIFQPFFTTKPTGEGTGLGLSLAYDIVTKGHGGTIEVESVEGEGTTFTIKLPL